MAGATITTYSYSSNKGGVLFDNWKLNLVRDTFSMVSLSLFRTFCKKTGSNFCKPIVMLEYNDRVGNGKFVGSTSFWISRFFRVFPSQDRKPSSLMTYLPCCTSIVLSNKWRIMGSTPSMAYSVNIRLSSSHYRLISFKNSAVLQF